VGDELIEDAALKVTRLSPKPGDVVVIEVAPEYLLESQELDRLLRMLSDLKLPDVCFIVCKSGITFEILTDEQLRRVGLQRIEKMTIKQHSEVYCEGVRAYASREPLDCPYPLESLEWDEWHEGYYASEEIDRVEFVIE
jgi:hypothetical protein